MTFPRRIPSLFAVLCTASSLQAATLYWDGAGTTADADGGSGTWNTTLTNWDTSATAGTDSAFAAGDSAVFGGAAGTITLGGAFNAGTVTFNTAGYTINTNGNNVSWNNLAGTGGFTKSGAGTLTLGDATTTNDTSAYSGNITIAGGELKANANVAAGAKSILGGGAITLRATTGNTATLRLFTGSTGNAQSYANNFVLDSTNGAATLISEEGVVTYSGTVSLTGSNNTINVVKAGKDATFTNVISGAGSLSKTGNGTLYLNGANTYTGGTTVSSGTLEIGGTGALAAGSYTGNISISSGATFRYASSATQTLTGSIGGGGTLDIASGSTLIWNGSNSSSALTISGAGILKTTTGQSWTGGGSAMTFAMTGGEIRVEGGTLLVASSANEVWTNNKSSLYVASGATFNGNEASVYAAGGIFVDALTGAGTIKVGYGSAGNTTYADKITFGVNNGSGTFSGSLQNNTGVGNYTKAGTGTQTLTGVNTYTGNTAITGGTLEIGGAGQLGAGTYAGAIANAGTLKFNTTAAQTLSGVISGAGALVKDNTGTLTLSGNNTYTGATSVAAGTLRLSGTNASAITVNTGGTLSVSSAATATTTELLTMNAGAILAVDASTTDAFTSNGVNFAGATSLLFNAPLTSGSTYYVLNYGAGGVTNFSNLAAMARGTLADDPANSRITFTAGTVGTRMWNTTSGNWDNMTTASFADDDRMFSAGDTVAFNDPASASVVTLVGQLVPASVSVNNTNDYTFSGTGFIAGPSTLTKAGAGSLTISTANTYSGGTTLQGGSLVAGSDTAFGTGTIALNGGTLNVGGRTLANTITAGGGSINGGGSLTGVVSGASSLAIATTTGTGLQISGVNTYSGGTSLSGTGYVTAVSASAFGSGTIKVTGGTSTLYAAGLTVANDIRIDDGAALTINFSRNTNGSGNGNVTYSGAISSGTTGALSVVNSGTPTSINFNGSLSGFLGSITLNSQFGNINFTSASSGLGAANAAFTVNGTAGSFSTAVGASTSSTFDMGSLAGSGKLSVKGTLSVGNLNTDTTFSGVIANNTSGALVKVGSGTLTLSGVNTYSGGTTLSGGKIVTGNGAALGSGAVTVAGGTLQIGATNLAGIASLTVNTGTLNTAGGTVTTTGAFALAGGTWVIGNTADAITAGSFALTAGVIDLTGFTNKSTAGTYSLISGTGTSSFTDANFTNGDAGFSYSIDGNGDLLVTAVPEPSTYGLLGAGALAAVAFVRRRRKARVA